jgi:hypothetical protein
VKQKTELFKETVPGANVTSIIHVGFEVFTAVIMKSISFWDITPCSPLSVNRRFGGTASIFRVEEISSASKQAASRIMRHGVISQNLIVFSIIQFTLYNILQ